jgi:hypothetical protein
MEEILASIRKIISDDTAETKPVPASASAPPPPTPIPLRPVLAPPPVEDDDDILELRPAARKPQPHYVTDDPVPQDLHFADPEPAPPVAAFQPKPEPAPEPAPLAPPAQPAPPPAAEWRPEPDRLISQGVEEAVSQSFGALANTVLTGSQTTLDDLVREMLKPMIRTWLDDNLPTMVERLVRAEIERVARGGR